MASLGSAGLPPRNKTGPARRALLRGSFAFLGILVAGETASAWFFPGGPPVMVIIVKGFFYASAAASLGLFFTQRGLRASRRARAWYRHLFDLNPHPMWIFDVETLKFLAVNDAAVALYGYTREEFLAMTITQIRRPDEVPALLKSLSTGGPGVNRPGTRRHLLKDGTVIRAEITSQSIRFEGRRAELVLAENVTTRLEAEEEVKRSQALLRMASRVSRTGAWALTLDGSEILWSEEVRALHEVSPDFVPDSENNLLFYAPESREAITAAFTACIREGRPFAEELEILTAKGRRVWVRTMGEAVRDADGAIVQVQGAIQDVSEHKDAEVSLLKSRRSFHQLADAMPLIVWTAEPNGRVDYASRSFTEYTGIRERAERWMRAVHPDDLGQCLALWKEAARERGLCETECRLRRQSDGAYRWHVLRAVPIRDDDDQIVKWYGTATDIHESKESEERANRMSLRLITTLESIADAFFTLDTEWRITYVNREGERLLQFPRGELLGVNFWEKFPGTLGTRFETEYREAMRTGKAADFETYYGRRNMWFAARVYPSDQGLAIYFADISARKHVEADRERLNAAIEQMAEILLITDPRGTIEYVNPAFERITGYSRDEALGQTPRILKSGAHDAAFYQEMWRALKMGQPWNGRMVNKRKDGTLFTEESAISPVFDDSGAIAHYVCVKNDITAQLSLEEQYRQSQKMEAVGRLAGGVAHDFNNMLAVILMRTELALRRVKPEEPVHAFLMEIRDSANRSADLTRQLLAYARQQPVQPRVLSLNETLGGMLQILRRLIGENISLDWKPGNDLWKVKVDPVQVDQVVANLCVNARDAIGDVGSVVLETGNAVLDEAYCLAHPGAKPGEYVALSVRDTGCGMDKDVLAHIFEPFYTTKEVGKGTGLGLATVYGVVKQNQGYIEVTSAPGAGTTFRIHLPRQAEEVRKARGEAPLQAPRARGETVFLVEDEPSVLTATAEILEGLGYTVLRAASADEALAMAGLYDGDVHLLLTDVIMPRMNGRDFADRFMGIYPETRCLFMSGYAANTLGDRGIQPDATHFIQKPFSGDALAVKIRAALEETPG